MALLCLGAWISFCGFPTGFFLNRKSSPFHRFESILDWLWFGFPNSLVLLYCQARCTLNRWNLRLYCSLQYYLTLSLHILLIYNSLYFISLFFVASALFVFYIFLLGFLFFFIHHCHPVSSAFRFGCTFFLVLWSKKCSYRFNWKKILVLWSKKFFHSLIRRRFFSCGWRSFP